MDLKTQMRENGFGKKNVGKILLYFCNEKALCVTNTWLDKNEDNIQI